MVVAIVQTIFAQPDRAAARQQVIEVVIHMVKPFPKATALLRGAEDDVLAYMSFTPEHFDPDLLDQPFEAAQPRSQTRTNEVQVCPDNAATLRLSGAVLL